MCVASVEDEIRLPQVPVYSPQWRKAPRDQSVKSLSSIQERKETLSGGPGLDPIPLGIRRLDIRSVSPSGAFLSFFLFFCFSLLTLFFVLRRTLYTSWSTRNRPIWMTSAPHWKWVHQTTQVIYFVLFSGKRLTNYGIVGAYVWFKYLAKKSRVSLLLLHVFLAEIRLQNWRFSRFSVSLILIEVKQPCVLWIHDIQKFATAWWFETKENYNEDNKQHMWKSAQHFPELTLKLN